MTTMRNTVLVTLALAMAATSTLALAQSGGGAANDERPVTEAPANGGEVETTERERVRGTRGEHRGAERLLRRLDADGSGDISLEEFSDRRLAWVIEADADGDGVVTIEELTDAIEQRRQERREARLLAMFDIDGDGQITVEELERHQEKRFALLDRNDDGVLSAEELGRQDVRRAGPPRHAGWHGGPRHHRGSGPHGGPGWHHNR